METRPLVLFDIGGVLLKLQYGGFYEAAAKASGRFSPEGFKKLYIASHLEEDALRGDIDAEEFYSGLQSLIESVSDIKGILKNAWDSPIEDMVRLKEEVYRSGAAVGLFSNMHAAAFDILSPKHPEIFNVFDLSFPVIFSHEVKSVKPDRGMYNAVASQFSPVVYVDDNEAYVKRGVVDYGWKGVVFTGEVDSSESLRAAQVHSSSPPTPRILYADTVSRVRAAFVEYGILK
jgi:FMN phosphatase YigB (HAD superfamily)